MWDRLHFGAWAVTSSPLILGVDFLFFTKTTTSTVAGTPAIVERAKPLAADAAAAAAGSKPPAGRGTDGKELKLTDEETEFLKRVKKIVKNEAAIAVNQLWNGDVGRRMYSWEPDRPDTLFLWARNCKAVQPEFLTHGFSQKSEEKGLHWAVDAKAYGDFTGGRKLPAERLHYCAKYVKNAPTMLVTLEPCKEDEKAEVYLKSGSKLLLRGESMHFSKHV